MFVFVAQLAVMTKMAADEAEAVCFMEALVAASAALALEEDPTAGPAIYGDPSRLDLSEERPISARMERSHLAVAYALEV
eukprot:2189299-Pyramimonas_sp.AAC.1